MLRKAYLAIYHDAYAYIIFSDFYEKLDYPWPVGSN